MINQLLANLNGCKCSPEWRLMTAKLFDNPDWVDILTLTSVWFLAALIVNPIGDFPLIDDWSFGIVVRRLIEEGIFSPTGWGSMNLITQTLWGALFCKIFGFSFTILRFSTLVISLLCLIGVYLLSREVNCQRGLRMVIALTVAFNPIYFVLSYTFMTDIHFLTFSVWAMLFFVKALNSESRFHHYIILGTLFSIAAILCRQIGAFVPLAFGVALLVREKFRIKTILLVALILSIAFLTLYFFEYWLKATGRLTDMYNLHAKAFWDYLFNYPYISLLRIAVSTFIASSYFGLFLIPICVALYGGFIDFFKMAFLLQSHNKYIKTVVFKLPVWVWLIILVQLSAVLMLLKAYQSLHALMPIGGDIIIKSGVGPLWLHDVFMGLNSVGDYPGFWMIITLLSILGAAILLWWIIIIFITGLKLIANKINNMIRNSTSRLNSKVNNNDLLDPTMNFFILGAVIYFLPISIVQLTDRYLIIFVVLLPLVFAVFLEKNKIAIISSSATKLLTTFSIGALAVFSITTTHDYLSWNRARWMGLDYLVKERGIAPSQIDGGFEFNGFYLYKPDYQKKPGKSLWWVEDDRYMVTFGEIPGYNTIRRYDYYRWMPPTKNSMFLIERSGN